MPTGLFFKALSLTEGQMFSYRWISHKGVGDFFPVYLSIMQSTLYFYCNERNSAANYLLFQLPYSPRALAVGKLTAALDNIVGATSPLKSVYIDHTVPTLPNELIAPRYFHPISPRFPQRENQNFPRSISHEQLLLHLFYDLHYSSLFETNRQVAPFKILCHTHLLLNCILTKAQLHYHHTMKGLSDYYKALHQDAFQQTAQEWGRLLRAPASAAIIVNSRWFADDLDEEMKELSDIFPFNPLPTFHLFPWLKEKITLPKTSQRK